MTEMHQISHSIVHAFLARLINPTVSLAAFSIAFVFNSAISTVNQVSIQGGISFITDRAAFWQLFRFFSFACIFLFIIIESVALTPLGNILYGQLMGASEAVVKQARITSAIMGLWTFPILIRNICNALVMVQHRTILITYATVIRLVSLGLFLFIYPIWLNGAAVGGAALASCMTVEAIYMVIVAHPLLLALEKKKKKPPSYFKIWQFSWPLMITQSSEGCVPLAINLFLGQLSNPDLALAGFGVVNGLVRAFMSPLRNLIQTAQTLIHSYEEMKVMFQFTLRTVIFFVVFVFVLFFSPLRDIILGNVMGLSIELNSYVTPGAKLSFLIAIFWGYSALLRGILSAMRRTGDIGLAVPIRLIAVVMVCSVTIFYPDLNGTIVGVLAFSVAFASESIFLLYRLRRNDTAATNIFHHLDA